MVAHVAAAVGGNLVAGAGADAQAAAAAVPVFPEVGYSIEVPL
jgi:hypothetical protein